MPCLDSKMEGIFRELALKYVSDLLWQNYVQPYFTEIDSFPGSKSRKLSFVVSYTQGNRKKANKVEPKFFQFRFEMSRSGN